MLNKKFKIKKVGGKKKIGVLISDKIKKKTLYGKLNVRVISKNGTNYKIKIAVDYEDMNLYKDDLYMVEYKLLSKCSETLWDNLLKKEFKDDKTSHMEDILNNDSSLNEEEINFINEHKRIKLAFYNFKVKYLAFLYYNNLKFLWIT